MKDKSRLSLPEEPAAGVSASVPIADQVTQRDSNDRAPSGGRIVGTSPPPVTGPGSLDQSDGNEDRTSLSPFPAVGDLAIGYSRPPVAGRWKKGQSGNPNGRKRGAKGVTTIVRQVSEEKINANEGGRRRKISKSEALVRVQFDKALRGDARAFGNVHNMMMSSGVLTDAEVAAPTPPLTAAEKGIVTEILEFIDGRLPGNPFEPTQ